MAIVKASSAVAASVVAAPDRDDSHRALVERGERWLRSKGCRVVLRDPFKAAVSTGECPDVLGWRDGLSILIECKVSRADFLADAKKRFRRDPALGMGDWRFYMAPAGILLPSDMPDGWGLLAVTEKRVEVLHGGPRGNARWWLDKPFEGNKRCETSMLVSALARSEWPPRRREATARDDYSAWGPFLEATQKPAEQSVSDFGDDSPRAPMNEQI